MTAADIQAAAETVIALSAAGAVMTWVWRAPRRISGWRRRRQRDVVLNVVIPACIVTLAAAVFLANRDGGKS